MVLMVTLLSLYETQIAKAQTCAAELNSLNICAPFVMRGGGMGSTLPSADCCLVLQSVNHECLCNTIRVAARLPFQCSLPPITCSN